MAFNASSFFLGVGSVIATIGVGFGGGVFLTDALVGKEQSRTPTRLEQRAVDKTTVPTVPIVATAATRSQTTPLDAAVIANRPQTVSEFSLPAQPQLADSFAKARETDIQREAQRQEQIKRHEKRKLAERKRRKLQEQRAVAERSRAEEQGRGPAFGAREQMAESPIFNFQ